jgi:GNAT superfamily N-acetyltransferase
VGVERHLQGRGIGTALLRVFCQRMDALGAMAYLETDKRENVAFYERFGFQTQGQEPVLEVPNWFMARALSGSAPRS